MFLVAMMQTLFSSSKLIFALFWNSDSPKAFASLAYLAKQATFIESMMVPSVMQMKYLSRFLSIRFSASVSVKISPLKIEMTSSL